MWLQRVNEQRYVIKEVKKSKWFDCQRLFDIVWEEEVVSLVATEKIQTLGCGCANEKETDIVIKKMKQKGYQYNKKIYWNPARAGEKRDEMNKCLYVLGYWDI